MRRWWFCDAPAERVAALRILIGLYALVWTIGRTTELAGITQLSRDHFTPLGVVRVLGAPLPRVMALAIGAATCVLLAAFVLGVAYRVIAPLAALGLLWTLTYRNSWGLPLHTENLLVLHVIVLACAPAADVWALAARREPAAAGYGWVLRLMIALTAATYVLAGIAKLRLAGVGWMDGEFLRDQIAIDNLRKAVLGDTTAPLAGLFLAHPRVLTAFCVLTLVIELGAPVALAGGRLGRVWALGAWGFHVGVVLSMNIWFPYPLIGLAYAPLLRVERPLSWLIGRWRSHRECRRDRAGSRN